MLTDSLVPEIQLFKQMTLKSKVMAMGEVKVQSQNVTV